MPAQLRVAAETAQRWWQQQTYAEAEASDSKCAPETGKQVRAAGNGKSWQPTGDSSKTIAEKAAANKGGAAAKGG